MQHTICLMLCVCTYLCIITDLMYSCVLLPCLSDYVKMLCVCTYLCIIPALVVQLCTAALP